MNKLERSVRRLPSAHPMSVVLVAMVMSIVAVRLLSAPDWISTSELREVWPASTFHTQGLIVDVNYAIGSVGSQSTINGPTLQSFNIPNTAYTFGEVNRIEIGGVVPIFPNDLFAFVIRNSAAADTTAHTSHSGAIAAEVTSVRSAGANDLTNTAIECVASGAQNNECLHVLGGDLVFDGGGAITQNSGTAFFAGTFLAALGTIFAESSGTNAIDISGNPTNAIKMRQAASQIDVDSAGTASLNLYNANSTLFTLVVSGGTDCNATTSPAVLSAGANATLATPTTTNCIYRVAANAANSTITGFSVHSNGTTGTLCNVAAVGTLTLLNDTAAAPADGFLLKGGINRILVSNECVQLVYVPTTARWMVVN